MCRMLGFISRKPISVEIFFPALLKMAKEGKNSPHSDGFGVCAVKNGKITVYKEIHPIWDRSRDFRNIVGNVGILHARKASWMKSSILCTHPFVRRFKCFAHNGRIEGFAEKCDSRELFNMIIEEGVKSLRKIRNASSLTFIMAENGKLTVCRYSVEKEEYYTLYEGYLDDILVVSSEPLDENFSEITNYTMVEYSLKDGRIDRREEKLCFR